MIAEVDHINFHNVQLLAVVDWKAPMQDNVA